MKIICIGRNYADHAKELNNPLPKEPVIFMKPKSALARPGIPVHYPQFTDNLQYECEVVLRVCKNGRQIPQKFAKQYFDHWTVGIDFTARDLQNKLKEEGLPWERAKAFDDSAVVGNFVPVAEADLYTTQFSLSQNGVMVQKGHTSDLIFSFEHLISYISQYFTLQIGDLIFTGTPKGVGPVLPYDKLVGYLNNEKMFDIEIK
ncbi:fumarylacetoacetate hydrolase family protein [Taibaiella lutea]|uniref:Fumarylacetoacetate hydrolase family protein n=1 Tax=Taibaiella lutea TaxID=2608001 RepID=A0A5M6CJY9_9BACT|nr:fumarylacetoacetate hydrolase family protein [Taibaiella lutea]KAA5533429.1 fumarylacetoacetate hydrolase family protein [Taibaiella lutea]